MNDLRDLADLHALGLLDPEAAAAVEARIAAPANPQDRALAAAVGAARDRFLALDLTAPEIPPPADAWARLAPLLGAPEAAATAPEGAGDGAVRGAAAGDVRGATTGAAGGAAPGAQIGATAGAPRARYDARSGADLRRGASRPGAPGPALRALRLWRSAALAGLAASVTLAALLGWRGLAPPAPAVVAVLVNEAGQAAALVEAFDDDTVFVTPLLDYDAGPTRALQLWTKPDPAGPPVSMGLLDAVTRLRVRGPDLPAPAQGQLYEITVEQPGGSPTGLPTGPIVGKGLAQKPL